MSGLTLRDRENEFFDSNFRMDSSSGIVSDFCYPRSVPRAIAVGGGEVRASIDDSPVLIRYPRFDEPEDPFLGFRVVEGVLVGPQDFLPAGTIDGCGEALILHSLTQRKALFQNAILWLLGAACDNFVTTLEAVCMPDLETGVPGHVVVSVNNNGACAASAVIVTQELPENLSFTDGWMENPDGLADPLNVWLEERKAVFGIGQLERATTAELHGTVVATQPGEYRTVYTVGSRLRKNVDHPFTLEVSGDHNMCPRLEVRVMGNEIALVQRGDCAVPIILEASTDLRSWTSAQLNGVVEDGGEILRLLPTAPAQYYRLVAEASEDLPQ